jgi:hypothetical protein
MLTRRDRAEIGCWRFEKRVQRAQCSCLGEGLYVDPSLGLEMYLTLAVTREGYSLPMRLAHAV